MDVEEILDWHRNIAEKYSVASANHTYLTEYKKSILALLMKDAEREGQKTSTAQERDALASTTYIQHLTALKEATHEYEKYRYQLRQVEMEFEAWRTKQANERMERKGYGA